MIPVHLARINYAGDLGYELWVAPEYQRVLFDRIVAAGRAARAAAVRDARADVAAAREELRDVVPRIPPDLHAARGRASPATSGSTTSSSAAPPTRPSWPPAARSGACARSSSSPTPTTRPTSSATSPSGTTAPSSAGSPRAATGTTSSASIALGYVPDRARRRPTGRAAGASRSRSSAGDGRRDSSPSRSSTRRACGCASDRDHGASRRRAARRRRSTRSPFEAGDSVGDRDPACRRGARPRRHALPGRRLRQLPRDRRRRRLRPDLPGRRRGQGWPSRAIRRTALPPLPVVDGTDATRPPLGPRSPSSAGRSSSSVIGGGAAGQRAVAGARRRPGRDVLLLDAEDGHEVVAVYPGPTVVARDAGRACSTSTPARSSSRPARPRSNRSARATTWPASSRPAPRERLHAAGRGSGPAVAVGTPPVGVPCERSRARWSASRATPPGGCGPSWCAGARTAAGVDHRGLNGPSLVGPRPGAARCAGQDGRSDRPRSRWSAMPHSISFRSRSFDEPTRRLSSAAAWTSASATWTRRGLRGTRSWSWSSAPRCAAPAPARAACACRTSVPLL